MSGIIDDHYVHVREATKDQTEYTLTKSYIIVVDSELMLVQRYICVYELTGMYMCGCHTKALKELIQDNSL